MKWNSPKTPSAMLGTQKAKIMLAISILALWGAYFLLLMQKKANLCIYVFSVYCKAARKMWAKRLQNGICWQKPPRREHLAAEKVRLDPAETRPGLTMIFCTECHSKYEGKQAEQVQSYEFTTYITLELKLLEPHANALSSAKSPEPCYIWHKHLMSI